MKYKIEIRKEQKEDFLIYAKEKSSTLEKIENILCTSEDTIFGYTDQGVLKLNEENIYCFFTEDAKIYAWTAKEKVQIKERLYHLEERFGNAFIRINQSCLVNVAKIQKFEVSIGGSLFVILKNGYKDYISRRQLKSVKERMGF